MINPPFGTYSPLSGVLLTCSGSTQYADASPNWFHAREYDAANRHASSSVFSEIGSLSSFTPLLLMTQLGAPWISACAYRSPSERYFFTTRSLLEASLPATTRFTSVEKNQRNRSNH